MLLAAFVISMLTWMPKTWENVFNAGLALSTIFLSITLITGMGGQLSLCQATLAGVGAFTAGQLANHLGLNFLVGGLIGAAAAAVVASVLALSSLRLKGLGLALMTLAAALLFDNAVFSQKAVSNGTGGIILKRSWFGRINFFDPSGHPMFILLMVVLVVVVAAVLLVATGHRRRLPGRHAGQRDRRGRGGHQPLLAAGAHLRPLGGGGRDRRDPAHHAAGSDQPPPVQLRVLARLRGDRGHHRRVHRGGGHPRQASASWSSSSCSHTPRSGSRV